MTETGARAPAPALPCAAGESGPSGSGGELVPELSVVIPFHDEEASARFVIDELRAELERLRLGPAFDAFEIVAVDDGSTDQTGEILEAAAREDPRIRVLRSRDNRGQAAALYWGLCEARAPILATMDGDGQNDPAGIPALLDALAGADMAVGIRALRQDSWLRRAMSRLANAVRARLLGDRLRDSGCALKAMRREVVSSFLPIRTLYSFMPALAKGAGFRLAEREVPHRPRRGGRSSYGLRQFLWRPLVDLLGVLWFLRRRFPPPVERRSAAETPAPFPGVERHG
jgi:glycosyltransferase involved in cell wall biosynthesis